MRIEVLRYFLSAARNLNFTRAAKECFIAQTAFSRYIAGMEKELGFMLFDRDTRNVALTPAGEVFYREVEPLVARYEYIVERARLISNGTPDMIKIGFGEFESTMLMPVIDAFRKDESASNIIVEKCSVEELWADARKFDSFDVVFGAFPGKEELRTKEVKIVPLFDIEYKVIVSDKNPLAKIDCVAEQDITKEILIVRDNDIVPYISKRLVRINDRFGSMARDIVTVNGYEAMFASVAMGKGVGIIPGYMISHIKDGIVVLDQNFCPTDDKYCMLYKNSEFAINALVRKLAGIVEEKKKYFEKQGTGKKRKK